MQQGLFGPNWRSNFEERVFVGSDGYMKYSRGDGSFWSFGNTGPTTWAVAAPVKDSATLFSGSAFWTITFHSGEQRQFSNTSGSLSAIIDRNGNTTQLAYDGLNRLTTVTDPASRHLYFSYQNSTSTLVTSVTSDVGLALSYSYDSLGRLTQYTKPDQTTVSIQYDSNSNISTVLDANGKVLESHTYNNCGQGLTSARAGGVDAVTLTFATPSCSNP
jgi:YD repeat-containing protein